MSDASLIGSCGKLGESRNGSGLTIKPPDQICVRRSGMKQDKFVEGVAMTTTFENVVLNRLENLKPGHVSVMWDRLVVRIGEKYNVSDKDAQSISCRVAPYTIEQAEQIIRKR